MGVRDQARADADPSFARFFEAHASRVQRSLAATLRDEELAADATAEAMARAYARWSQIAGYDQPAAWVYRVGLNWATSRWRRTRREVSSVDEERHRRDPGSVHHDPEVSDTALDDALAALSIDHRSVIVLRYALDWSEQETAAALGVAAGTVKSRASRALARLAKRLEDQHG